MMEDEGITVAGAVTDEELAPRVGSNLRNAREAGGTSRREIADELKLTTTAVGHLEDGHWDRLGAAVYVRGYLRAYGRRVDVDVSEGLAWFDRQQEQIAEETIAAMAAVPRVRVPRYRRLVSYAVATSLLAIPAVFILIRAFDGSLFLPSVEQPATVVTGTETQSAADETPRIASMTGMAARRPNSDGTTENADPIVEPAATAPASTVPAQTDAAAEAADDEIEADDGTEAASDGVVPTLLLELSADAWMDIQDAAGERLLYGLKAAESVHSVPLSSQVRVRIGNADAVVATVDGKRFDLKPFMRRDVADFTLTADEARDL